MVRALLFDFGNVIAFFDHHRATRRFAASSAMAEAEIYTAIYDGELESDFESGRMGADEFLGRVIELIGYQGLRDRLKAEFVDVFTPNPPVIALLPRLKARYRLILASNTNALHYAHFSVQLADALRHFDALGLSYQAGVRKPAPGFYDYCMRLAGCRAGECLFIDDLPANVAGAEAAGLRGLLYRSELDLARALRERGIEL